MFYLTSFLQWGPWWGAWHDGGAGGWGWGWWSLWWPLSSLVWLAVIGGVLWFLWRSSRWRGHGTSDRAREILAERFARGELTVEEYRERMDQLGGEAR